MELNEYQRQAMTTCMESSRNFSYMMLNLVGEVGEFASKVAKGIRKGQLHINGCEVYGKVSQRDADAIMEELQKECGDIMWQLFGLMSIFKWDAEDIARMNLEKLYARSQAGTIDGNGDGISGKERRR